MIKNGESKKKIIIILSLLSISCLLAYYFNIILRINIIFSHFFYLPIVLACIWWKYKGLIVPIFLWILLLFFSILNGMIIFIIDNLFRGIMFVIVGFATATLSRYLLKAEELNKAHEDMRFYRDLLIHDTNNILQAIRSSSELYHICKNDENRKDEIDEYINIIEKQTIRGVSLIHNVLKLSEFEEKEIILIQTEALTVLREAVSFMYKRFIEKTINIEILAENSSYYIYANDLLIDIFENIIINAINYNVNDTREIVIKVSQEEINNYVKIEFLDNGVGVEDVRKKKIFQNEGRAIKSQKGMGLGLTLVKKIMESYDGTVWVEDKILGDHTQGSNFILLFRKLFNNKR